MARRAKRLQVGAIVRTAVFASYLVVNVGCIAVARLAVLQGGFAERPEYELMLSHKAPILGVIELLVLRGGSAIALV